MNKGTLMTVSPEKLRQIADLTEKRNKLVEQRDGIQRDLEAHESEIEALLGESGASKTLRRPRANANAGGNGGTNAGGQTRGPRPQNKLKMRDAIAKVTARTPKTVAEIVELLPGVGFQFASANPKNSVGAYLYSESAKSHFKRDADGRYSPIKAS